MIDKPDCQKAATKALETLIANQINTTPIIPLPVLKRMKGVGVLSFTELSIMGNVDRQYFVSLLGENMDAVTLYLDHPKTKYVIGYNQRLPFYMLQRGIARELGHIVLGHDGQTRTSEARMEEAYTFAHYFLCPRPIIKTIQQSGLRFTTQVLANMTGCDEQCLAGMRQIPGIHVDAALNRQVKEQFADCLRDFISLQEYLSKNDKTGLADFGTYMDEYEE